MSKCQTVATQRDPVGVAQHDEEHLRRFLRARAQADPVEMRRWWDELVIDFFDRMDGFVAAAHKGRLDANEHEDAVQLAMIRFSKNLIASFEGVSMGELVNACKTLARGISIDVQRRSMSRRSHEGSSIDERWDADAEDGPAAPSWETGEARDRFDAAERGREVADFLGWALPQIKDKRRDVLAMTFEGLELPEICAELGISAANAYQLRSRGMKDLSKLKEQYDT